MKKYVAFNVVNCTKFYLKNNSSWGVDYKNLRIYLEDEVDYYFDKKKKRSILKTRYSLIQVEEYKEAL